MFNYENKCAISTMCVMLEAKHEWRHFVLRKRKENLKFLQHHFFMFEIMLKLLFKYEFHIQMYFIRLSKHCIVCSNCTFLQIDQNRLLKKSEMLVCVQLNVWLRTSCRNKFHWQHFSLIQNFQSFLSSFMFCDESLLAGQQTEQKCNHQMRTQHCNISKLKSWLRRYLYPDYN